MTHINHASVMIILFEPGRESFVVVGENLGPRPNQSADGLCRFHAVDGHERGNGSRRTNGTLGGLIRKASLQTEVFAKEIPRGIVLVAKEGIGASPEQSASLGP